MAEKHKDALLGWAVCANVSDHLRAGPEADGFYQGTRLFSPNTKVYLGKAYWGTAGDRLHVVGLARKTRGFVNSVVPMEVLVNLRSVTIYSPSLWTKLETLQAFGAASESAATKELERYWEAWERERPEKLR